MIVDKIENADLYANLSEGIAKAFEILRNTDFVSKEDGKYEVEGEELFYVVERYTTKSIEQGRLEAHKKYIDVQFVVDGEELIGFSPIDKLEVEQPYNDEKDIAFYKVPEQITKVNLEAGMFCVLFPQDSHMPGRQLNGPSDVLKVVVKAKVNA